ncbi:hypothetical protein LCGC14_1132690 [marine sediment metagenome]|uniref:Uncharacterized protein n=1 Tax=marine sediment metagenome TaxID=412755 RepID=A0A0F9M5I9_9ZZZZ
MKIKVPKEIKIGANCVTVLFEDALIDFHDKVGQARYYAGEIVLLKRGVQDSILMGNFLHELIHWIDHTYNNLQLNETQTDALANGIHILLDDLGVELDWSDIK